MLKKNKIYILLSFIIRIWLCFNTNFGKKLITNISNRDFYLFRYKNKEFIYSTLKQSLNFFFILSYNIFSNRKLST